MTTLCKYFMLIQLTEIGVKIYSRMKYIHQSFL